MLLDRLIMTTSTLHQLAIGLSIPEKTLHSWNKNFKIVPTENEAGHLTYSQDQIDFILHLYHLIKERGFTIPGAKQELEKGPVDKNRDETIQKLLQIRAFLSELKEEL